MNLIRYYSKYKWALFVLDIVLLNVSFGITIYLKGWIPLWFDKETGFNINNQWGMFIPYSFLILLYFQYSKLYKIQSIYENGIHVFTLIKTLFFTTAGFLFFQFLLHDFQIISRLFYLNYFIISSFLFSFLRPALVHLISRQSTFQDKVIILGAGKKGKAMLHIFTHKIKIKNVIGFLDDNVDAREIEGIPLLGKINHLIEIASQYHANLFLLAIDNISRERFFEIFSICQRHKLHLSVSSDYLKVLNEKLEVDIFDEFGMVRFGGDSDNKLLFLAKRVFDLTLATLGIIALLPFYMITAIIIKLSSRGQVIYRQIRIGKNGKPFNFYKFRSMYQNSDKDSGRKQIMQEFIKGNEEFSNKKIVNQKRITPIGKFLRKYNLDELPQLFNVIKGEMSLVGPRPCITEEWRVYDDWQRLRLNAIPGCTGVWQVAGKGEVDFEETVLMDIFYNQNFSPWLDLKIILRTIPVMLLGKGDD